MLANKITTDLKFGEGNFYNTELDTVKLDTNVTDKQCFFLKKKRNTASLFWE